MISIADFRAVLDYEPATGLFRWNAVVGKKRSMLGTVAGTKHPNGYIRIRMCRKNYYAHRLAWLYVHGTWPARRLDHKNGDPADNRIENLREATASQNSANSKRRSDNTTGFKGVVIHQGAYAASVQVNGRRIMRSGLPSAADAALVYERMATENFGEFARIE